MKKKRAILTPARHGQLFKFGSKFIALVFVVLFLLAFLRLHFRITLHSVISMYQASSVLAGDYRFEGTPKIAFLFLARTNLPLDFLWATFFKNVDSAMFSIYVRSEPGFIFNESNTRSALFYDRQLNNSIQVAWGEPSMIEAERLLFEAALDDPANQRFVLLSDSCIPLYSFGYIYSYLMSSPKSFVDSFVDFKENRYSPEMSPVIPEEKWRKGSQWITLIRRHAAIVADDNIVFPVFRKFCKRWPPADLIKRRQILLNFELFHNLVYGHNCIPDEHYVQTLLNMRGLDNELERRTLTYTLWNQSGQGGEMSSWHPYAFNYADASPQIIHEIKVIDHVNYDSEDRKEVCHVNSKAAPCFVFARKFTARAAMRLVTEGSLDFHDAVDVFRTPP